MAEGSGDENGRLAKFDRGSFGASEMPTAEAEVSFESGADAIVV